MNLFRRSEIHAAATEVMPNWWGDAGLSRGAKIARLLGAMAARPLVVSRALPGEFRQRHGRARHVAAGVSDAWEEELHSHLGTPWPCPERRRVDELLAEIRAQLAGRGLGSGRFTYGWYSDAESSLSRAIWCAAVHTRPEVVVETGVAHGVSSRIVLEALRQNDLGRLWSIDLPFPFDRQLHAQTGAAVTDACRDRWSYLEGSSRQRLPALVAEVGHVEMFVHDSLHTMKNTIFEMEQVAAAMPAGGIMLIDDIGSHEGFLTFARRHSAYRTIMCPSDDQIGIFGIAVKSDDA